MTSSLLHTGHIDDDFQLSTKRKISSAHQVTDDLLDPRLGSLHALLGPFQDDLVALGSGFGEADSYSTTFRTDLVDDLPSSGSEIPVVLLVDQDLQINDVLLRR